LEPESIRAVLEIAAKEHAAEIDRIKAIDAKSGPLLGGCTAAIALVAGLLAKPDLFAVERGVRAGILLALLSLVAAHLSFLQAIWVRTYHSFDIPLWNTLATMQTEPAHLMRELISAYEEMIARNAAVRNQKAAAHERGVLLLSLAIWLLALAFLVNGALHGGARS
ncbi:MAG: hypothetical protein ACOY93_09785, partial [Bacillota bacterium]